jgi:2-iminobutanoate/2-iminopropanoate deaminase
MKNALVPTFLFGAALLAPATLRAQPTPTDQTQLQYFGTSARAPISSAVKAGKLVFIAGLPGFDASGKFAIGDFPAQMKQAMDNITAALKSAGAGWDRVAKVNLMITRRSDFADMNRIYATYLVAGHFPARTTVVSTLVQPDSLIEIECEAVLP